MQAEEVEREKIFIKKAEDGTTSWIIITVAVMLLGAVIAGLVVRFLFLQAKNDVIQAEVRQKKKAELDAEIEMDSAKKGIFDSKKPAKGDKQFTQVVNLDQY